LSGETGALLEKYVRRNTDISVEDQIKFWLLFADFTNSNIASAINYGSLHGGGSPIMEQIAIYSQYDINARKELVKRLAGIAPSAPPTKK
jgi:4-hydroxyphenylacetate 3-monooxygenase/4-hydroxybutyryl-CoA dehydratase/vinylacetyl-CoA-Delta-isomerase